MWKWQKSKLWGFFCQLYVDPEKNACDFVIPTFCAEQKSLSSAQLFEASRYYFWVPHFLLRFHTCCTPSIWQSISIYFGDIMQFHLTRASFLSLINRKISKNNGIEKIFFWFLSLGLRVKDFVRAQASRAEKFRIDYKFWIGLFCLSFRHSAFVLKMEVQGQGDTSPESGYLI